MTQNVCVSVQMDEKSFHDFASFDRKSSSRLHLWFDLRRRMERIRHLRLLPRISRQ